MRNLIAVQTLENMSPAFMERTLMDALRLYYHPVGVTFLFTDEEVRQFKKQTPHVVPAHPMSFCQWEIAARMQNRTVLGTPDKLSCPHSRVVFGWKEIDDEEVISQLVYCRDEEQARRFTESKPRLPMGSIRAVVVAPLAGFSTAPHVVHMYCDSMQAYHLSVDFMAAMDVHPLPSQLIMSSSTCGGSVHCYQTEMFNYCTPCAGAYNTGKMERGESNVFVPGKCLAPLVARMLARISSAGSCAITKPGDNFPGSDVCRNCAIIHFADGTRE